MAQKKQVTWAELRVGVLVLAGIFLIAVGIFYVTGAGILAAKYRVKTFLPEVEGRNVGAPVRLNGVEIGNVDAIRINPKPDFEQRNIEVTMRLDRRFQNDVRSDSSASLITEGLLGNRYVSIKRGRAGTPIEPGGEVRGEEEKAIKQIVERGLDFTQNLTELSKRVSELIAGVERGQGNLGKLLRDEEAYNRIIRVLGRTEAVVAKVERGEGTIGKLVESDEVYQKLNSTASRLDAVLADVQSQKGTLGKAVYDPKVYEEMKRFLEQGNALLADARAGKGTVGRLVVDDALYNTWRDAGRNVESATAKFNQTSGTAGKFVNDPQLYDNLSGLSADLRKLVNEIRANPKKYLHMKFSIF